MPFLERPFRLAITSASCNAHIIATSSRTSLESRGELGCFSIPPWRQLINTTIIMDSYNDALSAPGSYGTQADVDDNETSMSSLPPSQDTEIFRQFLRDAARTAVSDGVQPVLERMQDMKRYLNILFPLTPMTEHMVSSTSNKAPTTGQLATLVAEALAEPVKPKKSNAPDDSETESDEDDPHKSKSILGLLETPELERDAHWARERLALYATLEAVFARERCAEAKAEEMVAVLQIEQEKLRIKAMDFRSNAQARRHRIDKIQAARDGLKHHMHEVGLRGNKSDMHNAN
ncbi:hypothetical protein BDZ89DRAFT_1168559 [Hymenopellis radicata]|nr:hypothetical protein BDZ89DRAFT_1168559 [Hymenopellis radicata]